MVTKTSPFSAVDSFYMKARVEGLSKKRIEIYDMVFKSFSKFTGTKALEEIRPDDMRGYILHLSEERKLSKSTVATHYNVLKTFFNYCKREEYIEKSPLDRIKAPKLPKQFPYVLSDSQVHQLLKAPDQKLFEGYRNFVIILMFLDTGMRLNELANLNLKDFNLQQRSVKIRGKGEKERIVYMGKTCIKALNKWFQLRGMKDFEEAVFTTKDGDSLKGRHIQKIILRLCKKAKIEGTRCSPHTLRRLLQTTFGMAGIPSHCSSFWGIMISRPV